MLFGKFGHFLRKLMGDGVLQTVLKRGKIDRVLHTVFRKHIKKMCFAHNKNSHQKRLCTQFLYKCEIYFLCAIDIIIILISRIYGS